MVRLRELTLIVYLLTQTISIQCGKIPVGNNYSNRKNNGKKNAVETSTPGSENLYNILPYILNGATDVDEQLPSTVFLPPPVEYKEFDDSANVEPNGSSGHINRKHKYKDFSSVEIKVPYHPEYDSATSLTHKPIEEPVQEIPKSPTPVDQLTKAAIEPVPVFTNVEQRSSSADESQNDTGKYEYEYIVEDQHWGSHFGHREYHNGPQTKGKYQVLLPDGRLQSVQYWSDPSGYHAVVSYESALKNHAVKNEIFYK